MLARPDGRLGDWIDKDFVWDKRLTSKGYQRPNGRRPASFAQFSVSASIRADGGCRSELEVLAA
jgi:hypothetical protein